MNWMRFVSGEEPVVQKKSNNFYLDKVMAGLLETNTLANWVRETNDKLHVRQY